MMRQHPHLQLVKVAEGAIGDPGVILARRLDRFARVVTSKDRKRLGDFYVGRPTRFGNPFRMADPKDEVERRRSVLAYAVEMAERSDADRYSMLEPIRRVIAQGGRLWCWCSPALCHGQVLAAWALGAGPGLLAGLDLTEIRAWMAEHPKGAAS